MTLMLLPPKLAVMIIGMACATEDVIA